MPSVRPTQCRSGDLFGGSVADRQPVERCADRTLVIHMMKAWRDRWGTNRRVSAAHSGRTAWSDRTVMREPARCLSFKNSYANGRLAALTRFAATTYVVFAERSCGPFGPPIR